MTIDDAAATAGFDPFELPDTIQLGTADDPYPHLAAARRKGPVQLEWPLPDDVGTIDEVRDPSFNVLGHDEVMTVLRDHETYSSKVLAEIMGPVLDGTMIAMDEPEHRAHRALVAPAFRPKLLARWERRLVRRVLDELIDSFAPLGRADLVRRLTFAFPVRVIARILGLPDTRLPAVPTLVGRADQHDRQLGSRHRRVQRAARVLHRARGRMSRRATRRSHQ